MIMVRSFSLILLTGLIFNIFCLNAHPLHVEIASEAGILINAETGKVLFGKNTDEFCFPASITKVATALFILKMYESRLDEKVVAKRESLASITPQAKKQSNYRSPSYWIETDSSHIGIKVGEEFTLRTLLTAMLIASPNDSANVMAEHLEGSVPKFVEKMNLYLKAIGCKKTTFCNPHGLHHPQHRTTAQDMAIIAKAAMQYPLFREIVASTSFTCPRTNLSEERYLTQTNQLLRNGPHHYKKATGIKTGTTSQAGKTLVASAKNQDRNLIAVVLGAQTSQDRYLDVTKMFEKTFNEKKLRSLLLASGVQKMKVKVPSGTTPLRTYLKEPLYYDFYPSEQPEVKAKIIWSLPKLPIHKDQCIGEAVAVDANNKIISRCSLYALENVKPTLFYQIKNSIIAYKAVFFKVAFIVGGILIVMYVWAYRKKGSRRRRSV